MLYGGYVTVVGDSAMYDLGYSAGPWNIHIYIYAHRDKHMYVYNESERLWKVPRTDSKGLR